MQASVEAALRAAVARAAPGAAAGALDFRPLAGGVNARSFVVRAGARELVVRLPALGAPALLDLATEAGIMRAAAAEGLAPAVVDADPDTGVLVTEYRSAAASWTAADARAPRNIARLAALLRRLHALPARAPRFEAATIAERYVARAASAEPAWPADAGWADELVRRARRFDARGSADALCHNDLFAANILDDGALVLVDFEYAVRADPLLDLAGYGAMNGLAADERALLWAEYRRRPPSHAEIRELEETVRFVRLLAYFWVLLGRAAASDPAAYDELGADLADMLHKERI